MRRLTPSVWIGPVAIGSNHPVVVQSMTNTDTADAAATATQVADLAAAGSEIVRITVNREEAASAVPEIKARLTDQGVTVPLVGDFHFNGHILLGKFPAMAQALDKYRINPGTVGPGRQHDPNFRAMVEAAIHYGKPVRIGANWGSLDSEVLARHMDQNAKLANPRSAHEVLLLATADSALASAELAESYGLAHNRIILSAKVSAPLDLHWVYRYLAQHCDYPLHLGLTEAGMGMRGMVQSSAGLTPLLVEGTGDTIRVSLTPAPGEPRTQEVWVAQEILQAVGARNFRPSVTSCPGCGRTTSTLFQELAEQVSRNLTEKMSQWRNQYPGVENLKVAVMGCVVNGPGESKHADIGISLPGTGESPRAPVYIDGQLFRTLSGPNLAQDFLAIVESYVQRRFGVLPAPEQA